jgi:hypothetical protein
MDARPLPLAPRTEHIVCVTGNGNPGLQAC